MPRLALSWAVDALGRKVWTFKIRPGVRFYDGSTFDAAAAVWNFEKLLNEKSPQLDARQAGQGRTRIPSIASCPAIDAMTLQITTKEPDAFLPFQLAWIARSSPAHWEQSGRDWNVYAKTPSASGPWKLASWTPRERAELVPNPEYWDKARVPKLDKLVPMPEAHSRIAALRSRQVDWIKAPPPDAVASLRGAVFQIVTNAYPHNWVWHFSMAEGSPLRDVGVTVQLEVMEWNSLVAAWRAGVKDPSNRGALAMNHSCFIQDPFTAFVRHVQSDLAAPRGTNWGCCADKEMDTLLAPARTAFEPAAQTAALQRLHEKFVNDQLFLMVTHDVNARALSPRVKGFVQAQNWFQSFSGITLTR